MVNITIKKIQWAAESNTGLVRKKNEDYYLARPDMGLWVICDGLGGHVEGESASWICAMDIVDQIADGVDPVSSIHHAHWKIWKRTFDKANAFDCSGTTVALLLQTKKQWDVAWVGDTRVWLKDKKTFRQITKDHSVAGQLLQWGEISVEESLTHPDRHKLTQAVGIGEKDLEVGHVSGKIESGQSFLMATDGLAYWDRPEKISSLLSGAKNPKKAVEILKKASLAFGAKDNFTIIVVGQPSHRGFLRDSL